MEPGEALPGRQRRRALRRRARPGRGAGLRGQARLSGGRGLREPDAPRAGDGRAGARGDHDPASTAAGPPRALARRVGGTHGGRGPRPRGGSVSRVGPRPARLPAARRRSAAGGLRPGAARHRPDRRAPSTRRRRAGRRARRRDQRLSLPPAGRLVQRALAAPHRQRLADDREASAPRVRQRHRPSSADPALHVVRYLGGGGRPSLRKPHFALGAPHPRRGSRIVTVLLALFGGVALQRALGGRLRSLLTGLSRNRILAVVSGAAITAIIQSSAATTLMLIGFVAAGLMTFRQTLGVILGADIGTTFTVQLIAFRVTDYSPLLVGLGFTTTFVARRRVLKDVGQALLGLGLLFLGLKLILDNAGTLKASPLAVDLLDAIAGNPVLGVLVGAAFSALVTSSAATLGLALAFAHQGLLSLLGAVAVVLGANIGTCITALTASIGAGAEAKRVAVAHIAFKLLGVALVFPFLGPFTTVVASTAAEPARQIANAHTLFNIGISLVFLPFTPWASRAIESLVPDAQEGDSPFRAHYLDERALEQPALAFGQATREALRMADVVQAMLRDVSVVFASDNAELLEDVSRRDDQVDFLEREIKLFLTRLGRAAMGPDLSRKEIALISFIGNLENIGDIIDKNLMELARKKLYQGRRFSDAGWAEIQEFHGLVGKNLERAIAAFAANDRGLAQEVLDQRPVVRHRERDLRESHLGRLRAGLAESIETSEIHLDVLTNLKRVSSHVSALAISILEEV